jgi:hypothetical protein
LEFAHVEAKQLSRTEDLIGGYDYCFRFADTRRAKQKKTSAWTARFRQAEFAALNYGDNAREDLGLAADLVWQQRRQLLELGKLCQIGGFIHPPFLAGGRFKLCATHANDVLFLSEFACDAADDSLPETKK